MGEADNFSITLAQIQKAFHGTTAASDLQEAEEELNVHLGNLQTTLKTYKPKAPESRAGVDSNSSAARAGDRDIEAYALGRIRVRPD